MSNTLLNEKAPTGRCCFCIERSRQVCTLANRCGQFSLEESRRIWWQWFPWRRTGGTPGSLEGVAGFPCRSLPYILFDFYAHIFTLQNIKMHVSVKHTHCSAERWQRSCSKVAAEADCEIGQAWVLSFGLALTVL